MSPSSNPATLAPSPTAGYPAGAFWGAASNAMQPAAPGNNLGVQQATGTMAPRTLLLSIVAVIAVAYVLFHWHYLSF